TATATTDTYPPSLHDALPICGVASRGAAGFNVSRGSRVKSVAMRDVDARLVERARAGEASAFEELVRRHLRAAYAVALGVVGERSEEHTSELQSRENLVCRLL